MNILILGSGGRENSLAWKFSQSSKVEKIYVLPGNHATHLISKSTSLLEHKIDFSFIKDFCKKENFYFVFCGPEKPLEEGIVDYLTKDGIPVFGPSKAAAQLETSKAFAKEIMLKNNIPTASYKVVKGLSKLKAEAESFFAAHQGVVIKASALAAGKGVFVCTKQDEISEAVATLEKYMQTAAETCVLEEIMYGREASYFLFIGDDFKYELGFAVDHKRLNEKDQGPNTGGMGAYIPSLMATCRCECASSKTYRESAAQSFKKAKELFTAAVFT